MSGKKPKALPKLSVPKELLPSAKTVPSPRSSVGRRVSSSDVRSTRKRSRRNSVVATSPTTSKTSSSSPSTRGSSRSSGASSSNEWDWKRLERIERNSVVDSVVHVQARPDTVVHKYLNAPPASGSSGAVASAAGGAAGSALGSVVKTIGGYAAGSLALKAAGKGIKFLAGKTPAGRAVKGAYAAYKIGRAIQQGRQVKALPAAVEIAKEVIF